MNSIKCVEREGECSSPDCVAANRCLDMVDEARYRRIRELKQILGDDAFNRLGCSGPVLPWEKHKALSAELDALEAQS